MAQTFVFEELDAPTREYLTAVRAAEGEGSPGVFAPTNNSMAGCGCATGLLIIGLTLALTLTDWIDLVYADPVRLAFLQTAGLLLGGWLFVAYFRSSGVRGSSKTAGHWVYADPLHLYEAYREQVKVTPITDVTESNFTHNYNNGSYQNSVVRIALGSGPTVAVTLNNEQRAEQLVVFLNYLAWARGPEGGGRAELPAGALGGLARYVAKNDAEPKDADGNINLGLVELDISEVPEEPSREGRATPNFLPYVLMVPVAAGVFGVMAYVVNPPLRDDAIYAAVSRDPVEPWGLQMYLVDQRNTLHRAEAIQRLAPFYANLTQLLRNQGVDEKSRPLREGMIKILDSLKDTERPVVSLRVTETGGKAKADSRVKKLREEVVGKLEGRKTDSDAKDYDYVEAKGGIYGAFAGLMPPVQPPPGMTFPKPRTAVGIQMIEFAEVPDGSVAAHFEIKYEFQQIGTSPQYALNTTVEFRTNVDPEKGKTDPVVVYKEELFGLFPESDFDRQADELRNRLLRGMVGGGGPVVGGGMFK